MMSHMARKKPQPDEDPELPPASDPARSKDRHKRRKMIPLPPRVFEQLQVAAERHNRPLSWQLRLIVVAWLEQEGLWPPPATPG